MDIFIDCEFNSMNGQLLSMALVPIEEKAPQFYQELQIHEEIDPWVAENVIPHLHKEKVDMPSFQCLLAAYLRQFHTVHLICDWPEDSSYFTRALITGPGKRINTPRLTIEIRRDLDAVSKVPHHALHDAVAMRNKALDKGLYYDVPPGKSLLQAAVDHSIAQQEKEARKNESYSEPVADANRTVIR